MKWFYRVVILIILAALVGVPMLPRSTAASAPARAATLNPAIYTPAYTQWLETRGAQVSGTPVTSAQARQGSPAWTVLIYMAADNNLEPFGMADFNEMEFVGSTDTMNVVLQIDRAAQYDTSDGDWPDTRRFFVNRDTSLTAIGSEMIANLGETNTGDPATLADFITWGITTYPAQHYALILWDHGGAWQGIATDESAEKDTLTLPELDQALGQSTQAAGIEKLDLIGFDACLMGSFEVYRTLAPYALYSVGSAELTPGNGWDYLGTLDALAADPSMTGDGLGRAAVDSFISFYTDVVTTYKIFNLGLVDLGQAVRVSEALQGVDAALTAAPEASLQAVIAARSKTPVFGAFDDPSLIDIWSAADMLHFMKLLAGSGADPALSVAAGQVFDAGSAMVLYYRSSTEPDVRGGGGVSIYFPSSAKNFTARYQADAPQLNLWQSFLSQLFQAAKSSAAGGVSAKVGSLGSQAGVPAVFTPSAHGPLATEAYAVTSLDVGNHQYIWIDYQPLTAQGMETLPLSLTVNWLTDGHSETPVMLMRMERDENLGVVNGTYYPKNGTPVKAQAVFDLTTDGMVGLWGLVASSSGLLPSEIQTQPGDIFHPDWLSDGPKGSTVITPAKVQLVLSDQPLQLVWKTIQLGGYRLTVYTVDVSGAISRDSQDLALLNSNPESFDMRFVDLANEDIDADEVPNDEDNCAVVANPDQEDTDEDGIGDACDLFDDYDLDADGIDEEEDNCPSVYNPDQADEDEDGIGDACGAYSDEDWDGIPDDIDVCPDTYDSAQADLDGDGSGDACDDATEEFDLSGDYSWEETESEDAWYEEEFGDEWGDEDSEDAEAVDDEESAGDEELAADSDGDGIEDDADNCVDAYNPDQSDADGNGMGDACDAAASVDSDGDGVEDDADNCVDAYNPDQSDADGNGIGDACDAAPVDSGGDAGGGEEG
jgi:hypothetical protein